MSGSRFLVDAAPEIRGEVMALLACDDGGTVSDWHDLVREGAASATRPAAREDLETCR